LIGPSNVLLGESVGCDSEPVILTTDGT
jgi:hypothetical protein